MIEVLTALLVIITGVYAWLTYRISRANESATQAVLDQNEALTRPYVVVKPYMAPMSRLFLTVENTGKSAAQNLKLTIDRSFYCIGKAGADLAGTHLFREGTETFAPGESVVYFLGLWNEVFDEQADRSQIPLVFRVTATYSFNGKTVSEDRAVDLRQYYDNVEVKPAEMKSLEEISHSFKGLISILQRAENQANRSGAVPQNLPLQADEGQEAQSSPEPSRVQRFIQDVSSQWSVQFCAAVA